MKKFHICLFLSLFSACTFGQVAYTDLTPDVILQSPYDFDLNKDSIIDFTYEKYQYWWGDHYYNLIPNSNSCFITNNGFIDTLNINDEIGFIANWFGDTQKFLSCLDNNCYGNWVDVKNKFVGVKLLDNGSTLYGWIRFDIEKDLKNSWNCNVTMKDCAISEVSNQSVFAGEGIKPIAENIQINDINNLKDGRDILVSFDHALEEIKINEYRIIIVKAEEISTFNLDSALLVEQGSYTIVLPNGYDFSDTLYFDTKDKNGNPIVEFVPYNVFILSITDSALTNFHALSNPSNQLTLTSPSEPALNLQIEREYIGGEHYEIQLTFDKAIEESTLTEYRIIFVKSMEANTFTIDSANVVSFPDYYLVIPQGTNYLINFMSDSLIDKNGDSIELATDYIIFVLSVADGIVANVNVLSEPSNVFNLFTPTLAPKGIIAEDIGMTGDASDLQIRFNRIPDESEISEYRIFTVKLNEADTFNLEDANKVLLGNYFSILPNGNNIAENLPVFAKDIDGDLIIEQRPYRLFVLSVANQVTTDVNVLSESSNILTLSTPDYFKAGQTSGSYVFYMDIEPDTVIEAPPKSYEDYFLDLNNDGINDFYLITEHSSSPSFSAAESRIEPLNNNMVSIYNNTSSNLDTLVLSSMINHQIYWRNDVSYFSGYFSSYMPPWENYTYGIWGGVTDHYLGLQMISDQDTIYGWLRLDASAMCLTIKDYAYQISNVGIANIRYEEKIILYPNPTESKVHLQTSVPSSNHNYEIEIRNLYGQLVRKETNIQSSQDSINVADLKPGVYFYVVKEKGEIVQQGKLVKK